MTCLVALKHRRGVILGADSAAQVDSTITRCQKIFRFGSVLLALSGDAPDIERTIERIRPCKPRDLRTWVARHLRNSSTDGLAACGNTVVEWSDHAADLIVDYTATGSGVDVALGALHYARSLRHSPRAAVLGALRAAAVHSSGVVGPHTLWFLPAYRQEVYR